MQAAPAAAAVHIAAAVIMTKKNLRSNSQGFLLRFYFNELLC